MREIFDVIGFVAIVVSIMIFAIFLGYGIAVYCDVNFISTNVEVRIDKKVVYTGLTAYLSINTGGATTKVVIYKRLFPIAIKEKCYVSKNVRVIPVRK